MCMYSLYAQRGYGMENAKVGENLTRGEYRQHACFKNDKGELACIKHGTVIAISNLQFVAVLEHLEKWVGQSVMATMIEGGRRQWGRHHAADCIKLDDETVLPLHYFAEGMTCSIPRKVRKDKGVAKPRNLIKLMGLDQIRADLPPDPKPDDEPTEPVEQEKEKEGEKKPEEIA